MRTMILPERVLGNIVKPVDRNLTEIEFHVLEPSERLDPVNPLALLGAKPIRIGEPSRIHRVIGFSIDMRARQSVGRRA